MIRPNRGTDLNRERAPRNRNLRNVYVPEVKKADVPEEEKSNKTWLSRYHIKFDKIQELVDSDDECPSPSKIPKINREERIKPRKPEIFEEKKYAERPTTTKEVLQRELDEKKKRKRRRPANIKADVSDIKLSFKW